MMKKKRASAKDVARIKNLIRAGKTRMMGDVGLLNEEKDGKIKVTDIAPGTTMNGGRGFFIRWSAKGVGFGEVFFARNKNGKIRCWSECMSRGFVKDVLSALVNQAVWEDEEKRS